MEIGWLVALARRLVQESGGPETFDATAWVAAWPDRPPPALNGKSPADFMGAADGCMLVAKLLALQQSGAYA